jgi:hypothetical protein
MSAVSLPGFPPATECAASSSHSPKPLRFVWHHIQPKEAGGATVAANLVQLCDSCHYSIHRLLWYMRCEALGVPLTADEQAILKHPPRRAQYELAVLGYADCQDANTTAQIPNEG